VSRALSNWKNIVSELLNTLMVCGVLVSLFPLMKLSRDFYDEWTEVEHLHWQNRGSPPFIVFYFAMFLFVPMIYGKDLERLGNERLLGLRSNLRYSLAITYLLVLAAQLN